MAAVARHEGVEPTMGQSPFALGRGQRFERGLFRHGAELLRQSLQEAGVLPANASGFVDLRIRRIGGPMSTLDEARDRTMQLLLELASSATALPAIVASPTLLIPSGVMLPEALLVIDVVAVTAEGDTKILTVGEVKTYPDRGGYTDGSELATARAQAGVYVHALRMVLEQLGVASKVRVSDTGFLVLSRPGSNRASIRAGEDLKHQAFRAARGFQMLEEAAEKLIPLQTSSKAARIEAVQHAATDYNERCVTFCDRARTCFLHALAKDNGAVLGEDVERLLGGIPLARAEELIDGATPENEREEELAARLAAPA